MKKLFLFAIMLMPVVSAPAQDPFREGEPVLVYSLPKTEFCIEVETEKTTQKPGMFYRYSERYLATSNVITEEKTTYRLKDIRIKTRAVPDPSRTYSFLPVKKSPLSYLTVNGQGILCGFNIPCPKGALEKKEVKTVAAEAPKPTGLLRLSEEYMLAGSEAKLAEGAAKQIYRIRESRLGLLTADVEHMPADGSSLSAMLEGMDRMEQEFTELFTGKVTKETQVRTICLTPDAAKENEVLFRLSALKGVVDKDDLSGMPYYITIAPVRVPVSPAVKPQEGSYLYSIYPAATKVSVGDGVNTFLSEQFFIPQFGVTVPIPGEILKQPKAKVYIDSQTGRLLKVE